MEGGEEESLVAYEETTEEGVDEEDADKEVEVKMKLKRVKETNIKKL